MIADAPQTAKHTLKVAQLICCGKSGCCFERDGEACGAMDGYGERAELIIQSLGAPEMLEALRDLLECTERPGLGPAKLAAAQNFARALLARNDGAA